MAVTDGMKLPGKMKPLDVVDLVERALVELILGS